MDPHPEGIEKAAVPEGRGACDAMLLGSIVFPPDGSYSIMFMAIDGRTGEELSGVELFKAWAMLAKGLGENETLSPEKRALCESVWQAIAKAVRG
jgi:hypothetical protein